MSGELPLNEEDLTLQPVPLVRHFRNGLSVGSIWILIGYAASGARIAAFPVLVSLLVYWLFFALIIAAQRRAAPRKIRFTPAGLCISARYFPSREIPIPYEKIRAANFFGRGWFTSYAIDAGLRVHTIPLARLGPTGAAQLTAMLRKGIESLPCGAARWSAIEILATRAEQMRRQPAWATRAASAALLVIFGIELAGPHIIPGPHDAFTLVDIGANASALVAHGQWWRVLTGDLLHLNIQHLFNNLVFLLIFGTLLERLAGKFVLLIVLLATGLAAGVASAAVMPHFGDPIFSVGASGSLAGVVGALGALTLLCWREMPAGFRLPGLGWVLLLGLNLALAFTAKHIDSAAHLGGLLTGLALGCLLAGAWRGNQPSLTRLHDRSPALRSSLAGLALLWLGCVGAQITHSASAANRLGDRMVLIRAQLPKRRNNPLLQNDLAYAVALNQAARQPDLRLARELAAKALVVTQVNRNLNVFSSMIDDTIAVLDDRLGDIEAAFRLEMLLLPRSNPVVALHMARLLKERMPDGSPLLIGAGVALPSLRLVDGTLQFEAPETVPHGARVIAMLRRNGKVVGLLNLFVPPGYVGAQILPLPDRYGGPSEKPPNPIWLDGSSTISIALFDSTGCKCTWPSMAPEWHALPTEGPVWQ